MVIISNIFISAFYTLRIEQIVSLQLICSNEMKRITLVVVVVKFQIFFIIVEKIPK